MAGWTDPVDRDAPVDVVVRPDRIEYRLRDGAVPGAGRLLAFAELGDALMWWVSVRPGAATQPAPHTMAAHVMMSLHWTGPKVRTLHE